MSLVQRHPGGVVSVGFKEVESAAACVTAMNGMWYGGRQLGVAIWDGITNYQVRGLVRFVRRKKTSLFPRG